MPEFSIYVGEAGLRAENEKLKRDLDAVRADNKRLRTMVGEPQVEVVAAKAGANGESFKVGNCTVSIGAPPGGLPPVNPALIKNRSGGVARAAQAKATPVVEAPPVSHADVEEKREDAAVLRFSMLELDGASRDRGQQQG